MEEFLGFFEENSTVHYIIVIAACVIGGWILGFILRKFLSRTYERSQRSSVPMDPTIFKFMNNAITMVCFVLVAIIIFTSIPVLHSFGVSLFASAGLMTLIIGFAAQAALANIIAGVFIVLFRPYRVGDMITVGENRGFVDNVTLRHTVINNFNNIRIVIPNSEISSATISNATIDDPRHCNHFEVGISYNSDLERAIELIREESMNHPNQIDNRDEEDLEEGIPEVIIRVMGWEDSSIRIRAYIWSEEVVAGFVMMTDLYRILKKKFDEEGIEIPFPHRTVYLRQNDPIDIRQEQTATPGEDRSGSD